MLRGGCREGVGWLGLMEDGKKWEGTMGRGDRKEQTRLM